MSDRQQSCESVWEGQVPSVGQQTELGNESGIDGEGEDVVSSLIGCSNPSPSCQSNNVARSTVYLGNVATKSVRPDSDQQVETVSTSSELCRNLRKQSTQFNEQELPLSFNLVNYEASDSEDSSVRTPTIETFVGEATEHSMRASSVEKECEVLHWERSTEHSMCPSSSNSLVDQLRHAQESTQHLIGPSSKLEDKECEVLNTERTKGKESVEGYWNEDGCWVDGYGQVWQPPEGYWQQELCLGMEREKTLFTVSRALVAYDEIDIEGHRISGKLQGGQQLTGFQEYGLNEHDVSNTVDFKSQGHPQYQSIDYPATSTYEYSDGYVAFEVNTPSYSKAEEEGYASWRNTDDHGVLDHSKRFKERSGDEQPCFSCTKPENYHSAWSLKSDAENSSAYKDASCQKIEQQIPFPTPCPLNSDSCSAPLLRNPHIPCRPIELPSQTPESHSFSYDRQHPHLLQSTAAMLIPKSIHSASPQPMKITSSNQADIATLRFNASPTVSSTTCNGNSIVKESGTAEHCDAKTIFSNHLRDPRRPHHSKTSRNSFNEHVSDSASTSSTVNNTFTKELGIASPKKVANIEPTTSHLSRFKIPKISDGVNEAKPGGVPNTSSTCSTTTKEVAILQKLCTERLDDDIDASKVCSSPEDFISLFKGLTRDMLSTLASCIHLALEEGSDNAVVGVRGSDPLPSSTTVELQTTPEEIRHNKCSTSQNDPSVSLNENFKFEETNTFLDHKPQSGSSRTVIATILSPTIAMNESKKDGNKYTICIPIEKEVKLQVRPIKTAIVNGGDTECGNSPEGVKSELSLSKAQELMFDPKYMYKEYNLRKSRKDPLPISQERRLLSEDTENSTTSNETQNVKRVRVGEDAFGSIAPEAKRNKYTITDPRSADSLKRQVSASSPKKSTLAIIDESSKASCLASSDSVDKCGTKCHTIIRTELFCSLCKMKGGVKNLGFIFGPYRFQNENKSCEDAQDIWLHEDCAVWASGLSLVGRQLTGLYEAINDANKMVCSACKRVGATLLCTSRGCKNVYHFPCAIEKGCLLVEECFMMNCPRHKLGHN